MRIIPLFISFIFFGCSIKKENNLAVFLENKNAIYRKEKNSFPNLEEYITELNVKEKELTFSFWMKSNNYSKNGIIFSLVNDKKDELKKTILTFFVSKQRLAIISNNKDYRKREKRFGEIFSDTFLKLPTLDLKEKYFVSCTYSEILGKITVYVDGKLYFEYELLLPNLPDKFFLKQGLVIDNRVPKYYFKGTLNHFYLFPSRLKKKELDLLMHLTLTKNYPLN